MGDADAISIANCNLDFLIIQNDTNREYFIRKIYKQQITHNWSWSIKWNTKFKLWLCNWFEK